MANYDNEIFASETSKIAKVWSKLCQILKKLKSFSLKFCQKGEIFVKSGYTDCRSRPWLLQMSEFENFISVKSFLKIHWFY